VWRSRESNNEKLQFTNPSHLANAFKFIPLIRNVYNESNNIYKKKRDWIELKQKELGLQQRKEAKNVFDYFIANAIQNQQRWIIFFFLESNPPL
jgi:hypothetical protein